MLLPAGVVTDHEVVARLHQAQWDADLEVFTTVDRIVRLRQAFRAWVVETTTTASPFRFGQFTVEAANPGINLARWSPGEISRADLLLPPQVWETVDRTIHGSLAMSERLAAAGLASSAGVLCVGPPGTGKSPLARIVAAEVTGRATVLMATPWAAQRFLTPLFRLAAQLAPAVVVIDDLDLVVGSSRRGGRAAARLPVVDGRGDGLAARAWSCSPRPTRRAASTRRRSGRRGSTRSSR